MSLDPNVHAAAIQAALDVLVVTVYEDDNVPGSNGNAGDLPPNFLILAVERRFADDPQKSGRSTTSGWRFSLRSVGLTVNNARMLLSDCCDLLNNAVLTIDDVKTTPVKFESGQAPTPDDGRYSGFDFYTYAI